MDEPKSLRSSEARAYRLALIEDSHVAPLTAFVKSLRERMGPEYGIPYFDPLDGGISADCLFLLEAPGRKAVESGFISRNNPDETAKNLFLLSQEAGIDRRRAVIWNVVPWYIGSGTKVRPATPKDLGDAAPALVELAALLPTLHSIVLLGAKASTAQTEVSRLVPKARLYSVPHPSPVFVNRRPGNKALLLEKLREVAVGLPQLSYAT